MKVAPVVRIVLSLCVTCAILIGTAFAEPPKPAFKADKELCSLMVRFGLESFQRNRFKDAKYYFQMAVQADPGSQKAWNYYDLASMYTVAEEMKDTGKFMVRPSEPLVKAEAPAAAAPAQPATPSTQPPAQVQPPAPSAPQPPAAPAPTGAPTPQEEKKPKDSTGFKIVDDEGC